MRRYSAREMLNKLRWHPEYDFSRVRVVYLDRFQGFLEFSGEEVEEIGHKFVYLKSGTAIPQHRIVEIKYGSESIWKRK
ncbi:MAG: RNA repair domain-containing protein [Archaeoglobaceae archaeon]|nr:RNA repair domain-containing protein [Archaeoglobaceae archaeon]MDW8128662.1 RNA repair domain-containing protein [Archaeoglobaceae archaeon]